MELRITEFSIQALPANYDCHNFIHLQNAAECHASIEIVCPSQCSNSSTKHFTCLCSKLNQMYNISATVLQDGVMSHMNYAVCELIQ